jgi:hypothetical protein
MLRYIPMFRAAPFRYRAYLKPPTGVAAAPHVRRGGRHVSLAVSLLACLAIPLTVLNPPDRVWVPGAYDGADLDDLVLMTVDCGPGETFAGTLACLQRRPSDLLVTSLAVEPAAEHSDPSVHLRAPPLA